jgi:deoxyribonuclease IV
MRLGAHMSVAGGLARAYERGASIGCEAMQVFTKSERQWQAKPLLPDEVAAFRAAATQTGIGPVLAHDSYLINLASPDDALRAKSKAAFAHELERCEMLGIPHLVTHPGAHVGSGEAEGLRREAEVLNELFAEGVGGATRVLLETTAGQGTTLGARFEHLALLLELVPYPERLGICVDTCHIFAAGYDIRDAQSYAATFDEFEQRIGLRHIYAFHLNDSQKGLGSRVDRHAAIGAGEIGVEAFRLLVNDARFAGLPMVLETPKGPDMAEDVQNMHLLRSLVSA